MSSITILSIITYSKLPLKLSGINKIHLFCHILTVFVIFLYHFLKKTWECLWEICNENVWIHFGLTKSVHQNFSLYQTFSLSIFFLALNTIFNNALTCPCKMYLFIYWCLISLCFSNKTIAIWTLLVSE